MEATFLVGKADCRMLLDDNAEYFIHRLKFIAGEIMISVVPREVLILELTKLAMFFVIEQGMEII